MRIALVGNQNCGKTSLFNLLTGLNQKIGNWPGVTLERKSGMIKGTKHELVDLPGIYSLFPYTSEENVSREFLLNEKLDCIINIVDATSLERGLYLTTQLMDLNTRVILVLNMADRLKKKGLRIDIDSLKEKLGLDVCLISASRGEGIEKLIKTIDRNPLSYDKVRIFPQSVETIIRDEERKFRANRQSRFLALENLSRFEDVEKSVLQNRIEELYGMDAYEAIIHLRYEFISYVCEKCVIKERKVYDVNSFLDKIFLNRFLSLPIFVLLMLFVYYVSITVVGNYIGGKIEIWIDWIKILARTFLENATASEWIISLVCDGIITGVCGVLSFLPQLIVLFICISVLEATGYMARLTFLLDKIFRKIGISGKTLIPFIVGSGCSVPGIMSSRILENEYDKKVATILTPFVPCSAKLPMIALFTSYFFDDYYSLIAVSFYLLSICIIVLSAFLFQKIFKKQQYSTYISELPDYKLPNIKLIANDVYQKIKEFVKKAGTIIFASSILVWFLLSFSMNLKYGVNVQDSILAWIGQKISFVFYPIVGHNSWEVAVSAFQGIIAKEQVVSSMKIISGLANDGRNVAEIFGMGSPFDFFTKASAYSFVVFNLFTAPCFATIGAMKKELGSFRATIMALFFQVGMAWCLSSFLFFITSKIW